MGIFAIKCSDLETAYQLFTRRRGERFYLYTATLRLNLDINFLELCNSKLRNKNSSQRKNVDQFFLIETAFGQFVVTQNIF